jgi:hypothetical protein
MTQKSMSHTRLSRLSLQAAAAGTLLFASSANAAPTLEGWANLPATTTAVGPTTGQFGGTGFGDNSNLLPILNGQAVQGFSAVLRGPRPGTFYVMPDNGFGAQANSADALLRVYAVEPDFKLWNGRAVIGRGTVSPVKFGNGRKLSSFSAETFISLRDPNHALSFPLQADLDHYYGVDTNPLVDPSIKAGRLLTGADFDIESVRRDKFGNLWFGEEFGPFLVKTDKTGKVLRSEIPLPNIRPAGSTAVGAEVQAPQNPHLNGATPNLATSHGFEGMAINKSGDKLYTLLEGTVTGDVANSLRIDEFDIKSESYTGRNFLYPLDALGTNIGDMTAINDHQFLVIERNGNTATTTGAPFKRIFEIDTNVRDANGFVGKTELVDLMNIADPHDLNGDGSKLFTFPYVTIEDVLIVDPRTLLVINDDNFPGGGGRSAAPDSNEFLLIRLDRALDVRVQESCDASDEDEDEDD